MSAGGKAIKELITDVLSSDRLIEEREEAFREIVSRFQDLAYACAYAFLKNFSLSEEAAQQAFITAWQKLDQLHEPEAFPGWFRRIVVNECHRLTRGKRLRFVPIESALAECSIDPRSNPLAQLEFGERRDEIRRAIESLPENERLVTSLFYISEYSQREVADFLELPLSTVVKRLYTARQRLKQRMIEMVKRDIHSHRPSRNDSFAEQVGARLRPYSGSDWTPIKEFAYAVVPDLKQDEETWLRNRNRFDENKYTRRHYIAEENKTGNILGYGSIEQTVYLPRYRLFLVAEPRWLTKGVGDLLLDRLMIDLREANAITVWHRTFAHQQEVIDFLLARGFVETRRVWDLRLDVTAVDRESLRSVSDKVAEKGITIARFPEELQRLGDPAYHKLHEFLNLVKQDDPERQPFTPAPFESVVHWFGRSYVLPDACFIAKHGDEYIGFTDLNHIEPIPNGIMHGFTGVSRTWRRQGIGTALKLRAIDYAREHGYRFIRAFNLPSQEGASALNEKLGFKKAFGYVTLEKLVKQIADVDLPTIESYAGKYEIDPNVPLQCGLPADLTLTIKMIGNRLISELRDMQDELFPESNDMFFTDHHYARFEFTRDQTGEVTGLVYHEDGHHVKARKST